MKIKNNIYLLICAIFMGCNRQEVGAGEYMEAWEKAKPTVSAAGKSGGLEMKLTYLPTEYLVLSDAGVRIGATDYIKNRASYCDHIYCALKIRKDPSQQKQPVLDVPKYFARDRQRQFLGLAGKDTLRCALYQPELAGNQSLETTVNAVFSRPAGQNCETPLADDLIFIFRFTDAGEGEIRIKITKDAIHQLPKIKF